MRLLKKEALRNILPGKCESNYEHELLFVPSFLNMLKFISEF